MDEFLIGYEAPKTVIGNILMTCRTCGQCHPKQSNHLYDYEGTVNDDLICRLCYQPFVNPVDTKCGCTYCFLCLTNFLRHYKYCPIDNQKIDIKQAHKTSDALKKILDKLLIVCPNVDYCEEVFSRNQLEAHLLTKCKGTIIYCSRAHLGCNFQCPRNALTSHLQECEFRDSTEKLMKDPIVPGKLCQVEIHRGYENLGIYIVGAGWDTPLVTTIIQEIKPKSAAAKDNRLQPGDHILRLNGNDLTEKTHKEIIALFEETMPICSMVIYREVLDSTQDDFNYEYREEILRITFEKETDTRIGIRLGHKKKEKGIWIKNIVQDSLADRDGRLKINDRLLEINCQNVKYGHKSDALKIILASSNQVQFLISREIAPNSCLNSSNSIDTIKEEIKYSEAGPSLWQEFTLAIAKKRHESLGLRVKGGVGGYENENTPIFVSSIEPKSCLEKNKHIKKGDLIIKIDNEQFVGRTYEEASEIVEKTNKNEIVTINYVHCMGDEVESTDYEEPGLALAFKPTWRYFIAIPTIYQIAKNVQIYKDPNELLGITISGGCDTKYEKTFVKTVIRNSSAAKSNKLRCGDMIISINGVSLHSLQHSDIMQLLKSLSGNIRFTVISCPGTFI